VTTYQWLLLFHVLAAFMFLSGSIVAGVFHYVATRRERPSEVALLLGLVRPAVAVVAIGSLGTLGLGLWLVDEAGYGYGEGWIVAAIVLWLVSGGLAGPSGKKLRHARELAEKLAREGDQPSDELRRAVAERRALAMNYASFLLVVAILVLMIFKPGAS
jgi:uncharacterized membrane protein